MKIASLVVFYNPRVEEIEHILDYYEKTDVTIVLDNSKEDHKEQIFSVIKNPGKMLYIHFPYNIGLCAALNKGIEKAKKLGCEWALLMDSDSMFLTDIIGVYTRYLTQNKMQDIAVLAPVHIFDRSTEKKFCGSRSVKWTMTSGCLYRIDVFCRVGGFKKELFVDGLDIDYCYKIRTLGYKVIELSDAKLKHFPAETKSISFLRLKLSYGVASPWRYYMQARAIIWLILKYHQVIDVFRYLYKWIKVVLLFDNKKKYIKEMLVGSKEGFELWRNEKKEI